MINTYNDIIRYYILLEVFLTSRKIILSGIQSTANLTLGNYLGAIKNWVDLQEDYECYFMSVDHHDITVR